MAPDEELVRGGSPLGQRISGQLQHLRFVQDFFHNPLGISLRDRETSTSAEEARQRLGELAYQLDVLKALEAVLTEEMEMLRLLVPGEPEKGRDPQE